MFRAFFDDALAKGGALAIVDKTSGAVIGSSRFQYCDREEEDGALEIGWSFLARRYWGRGYNAELRRLVAALPGDATAQQRSAPKCARMRPACAAGTTPWPFESEAKCCR